ncbi:alpha-amylase family glycosyl hydrolase [Aliiglaciecola sp. CAU 1673]|uniref:alpha-amylase family glycosyl hydrolase n=1 Tax=Aliiglaciecola sp. CAU 1673 TaxID=3032595 RepID=UPI0023DBBDB1|nr:alpha-amylase family glycosyl hydrolase [Aliiglaciecola sp. CAU 1673]MDF2179035.1 alpha-amylase family glycosyl hydrolase [Aliiglaciecola sp. CAU 1673]
MNKLLSRPCWSLLSLSFLIGCQPVQELAGDHAQPASVSTQIRPQFVGTEHPFASEAVYFLVTDRFVDGDPSNNHEDQGGDYPTFNLPLLGPDGRQANVGYMGGDFKGVLNNAQFIRDMGFTAIWMTPIVDNPDQAFSGGTPIAFGESFKDGGKTGYHGYWGVNFFKEDEHYPSEGLGYKELAASLKQDFGIKSVFDIVTNHGSPSFSMPVDQPKFGEIYGKNGELIADHQNLPPEQLDPTNPLHQFFHTERDIMELSNLNDENPAVLDYFVEAYSHWIEQGADAFRIDTIKHVPHHFWKAFADRIRAKHPGFFMFGESYNYDANFIAQHTLAKNGGISVLDFPGQQAMAKVFSNADSDFAELADYLHLTHGPYANPYELMTFYDNHDMARMNASDNGFIDAHNWLFTSRGIPVVYMGSEMGYMRGAVEHQGNRNYYGQDNIELAKQHPIQAQLSRIAALRKQLPALQRGLQVNLLLDGHQAAFYRVLQDGNTAQTAMVLLNKGDEPAIFAIDDRLEAGQWQEMLSGNIARIEKGQALSAVVAPHDVQVWLREGNISNPELLSSLKILSENR